MSSMPPPPPGGDQSGYQPGYQYQGSQYQGAPQYGGQHPGGPVGAQGLTTPPRSIVRAKYAMWAGAVVQLLAIPVALLMQSQMREIAEQSMRDSGQTYDQDMVDMIVAFGLVVGVLGGLVGAGLWFLMAYLNGKGLGWARIVATVLYGIFVLSFLCGFAQPNPLLTTLINVVVLVIGGLATFFLWQKDSTAWFTAHQRPTY